MGNQAEWQRRVEEFVFARLGDAPVRVLEVGCGKGELAEALVAAGHRVVAVDPDAPDGPLFRRLKIEDFADPNPFDYAVAILSLHHVEDLETALNRIEDSLTPKGTLVAIEFAWDQFDEATVRWALDRLPPAEVSDDPSWLQRCCRAWVQSDREGRRTSVETHFARWAKGEALHDSRSMLPRLRRHFVEGDFAWIPYLYPDLDERTSHADEWAAIRTGRIKPTGFRFVGQRRAAEA